MNADEPILYEILWAAAKSPLGVKVLTEDPEGVKAKLRVFIRENTEFSLLSIHTSRINPTGEIWILKDAPRTGESDDPTPQGGL